MRLNMKKLRLMVPMMMSVYEGPSALRRTPPILHVAYTNYILQISKRMPLVEN